MWKTIPRIEIKDGWGYYELDLIWEDGIVTVDAWPIAQAVDKLYEATKNDKRWDILSKAVEILEKSYWEQSDHVKSTRVSTEELSRTT